VIGPRLVLADEPTANLDGENGRNVLELMHGMNHEMHTTFLLSTHDPRVLPYLDRRVYLEDGLIVKTEVMEEHV
jgi:putative ABC transport system ATP-binding protein